MHHEGEEADGLLAAWTALWHPALLATTGAAPSWHRGDSPPSDLSDLLILVPGVSVNELPTGFPQRAIDEGARMIQGNLPRSEILSQALEPIADLASGIDSDLVADFLALGYCYLQVELLTRQMRYSTNLDELHFYKQAIAGAKAAAEGNVETARDQLTACFDLLAEERDHYYAVDAYVIDLTLLAATTLGANLCQQLDSGVPVNLLLTVELLNQMRDREPASFAALQRALKAGLVGLVGGELVEDRVPLHGCETVLRRLHHGRDAFAELLGQRPHVYGRRRFGLSVLHPQLLNRLGYIGALHAALGEGLCPEGSQLKIRWEGPDHQAIDAVGRAPLDAAKPATFLSLASKLGESMDMDHVATICIAHWPGKACPWYDDLRRVARYGAMLGKLVTVDEYFRDTDYPGQTEQFKADQYRSPYLQQAVSRQQPDPISTSVRYWRQRTQVTAIEALGTMVAAVRNSPVDDPTPLIDQVDAGADQPVSDDLDRRIEQSMQTVLQQVAALLPRGESTPETGYLVINPSSYARRSAVDMPGLPRLPTVVKPVYAAEQQDGHKHVVVDVPPMGFAWVTGGEPGKPKGKPARKPSRNPPPLLAEENRLFNEYFEAHVNPTTGSLQAVYDYQRRGNRLSQQLAVRASRSQPASKHASDLYSVMAADQVRVTNASTVMGEITSTGRLLDRRGKTLAKYEQQYRVWRGRRVLELEIQIDPLAELSDDPWNSYYCCRAAWAGESALLWRGVNQLHERAEAKRFEAPNYIDIDDNGRHTTLLTGGLPFHRRTDLRMLDTLLIVKGENARSFKLGIGVNLSYPLLESLDQMAPLPALQLTAPPPSGPTSSWLFHIDSRNVTATAWQPVVEQQRVVGFRVRLLETTGRSAHARIQSCRAIVAADRCDFNGGSTGACSIEKEAAVVDLGANEWIEVVARWSGERVESPEQGV